MNIGVFGGTFDPPHLGHLIVAEHVREQLDLQKMFFIPAAIPPHKQQRPDITSGADRLQMLLLATENNPVFSVCDMEIRRAGVSYTVDTLKELRMRHRNDALFLLIGMDNLPDFATWKEPKAILEMATIIVMTRPGYHPDVHVHTDLQSMVLCEVPEIGISSRQIRQRVSEGHSIRYLVPAGVASYIQSNGLYRK